MADNVAVYNTEGKQVEKIDLNKDIFDGVVNNDLLYQVVKMYQSNKRQGTVSTKTRGEVSGGGIKPWRQKGTGRARVGSIRSPLWRGGGIVFGPHPREFNYSLSKKIKSGALRASINAKLNSQDVIIIDQIKLDNLKTKEMAKILGKLKIEGKALIVLDPKEQNISLAIRNIPNAGVARSSDLTAFDVLNFKKLILTKAALKGVISRIKG
ncbi:MAG: 50S ribosomal protein L4 [Candidatus Omnitrophica bacterium]|nr:50S ribosomal protein L4 [Candidatus Omnitrophota bacterium]